MLMRESLMDREVQRATETPVYRMLPEAHVIKVGGRSVMDAGRAVVYPVVEALAECLKTKKLIIGTGGGVRSRHVFSIGIDLGLPTGVLAQLAGAPSPKSGATPPHRSDAGSFLLAECFGCKSFTLVKDVDGLYERDPRAHPGAKLISEIDGSELKRRNFDSLPFERILLDLLENARLVRSIQIVNGRHPERIKAALEGEHVGTIIHAGH